MLKLNNKNLQEQKWQESTLELNRSCFLRVMIMVTEVYIKLNVHDKRGLKSGRRREGGFLSCRQ